MRCRCGRGLAGITGLSMRGFQLMIRIASGIRSLPRIAQYALIYCAVVGIAAVAWTTQIPERRSGSLVLYSFVVMPLIVCLGVVVVLRVVRSSEQERPRDDADD